MQLFLACMQQHALKGLRLTDGSQILLDLTTLEGILEDLGLFEGLVGSRFLVNDDDGLIAIHMTNSTI